MEKLPDTILSQIHDEAQKVDQRLHAPALQDVCSQSSEVLGMYNDLSASVEAAISSNYPTAANVAPVSLVEAPEYVEDMDMAAAMFPASKAARANPKNISEAVAGTLSDMDTPFIADVKSHGPYVNLRLNRSMVYNTVLSEVLTKNQSFGCSDVAKGSIVQIDYSSPNIAKRLGLQHAPTTIVGEALARINEATGAKVIRSNHLGDFGTPFGKVLVGIKRYGDSEKLQSDPVGHMHELYVRVNAEAKENPDLEAEARQAFAKLEAGDPSVVHVWEQLRAANIAENNKLYDRLDIKFDTTIGESYFVHEAQAIVDELIESSIATEDDNGSVFVDAEKAGVPIILRKSDGTTLYGTRDLAALRYRMSHYEPNTIKYVVGAEQAQQLEAVFAVAALAKIIPDLSSVDHVKLGLLAGENGKKLSSRSGMTDTFEGILDAAVDNAAHSLQERYAHQPERAVTVTKLAEILGVGAVAYTILRKDPASNTTITEQAGATKDAGTAGYLQYTHARAQSVVRKSNLTNEEMLAGSFTLTTEEEWKVVRKLTQFPSSVVKAAETNGPHHVARNLEEVASVFSSMYESPNVPILSAKKELRRSRVAIAQAVSIVLRNGLHLLNIQAPDYI